MKSPTTIVTALARWGQQRRIGGGFSPSFPGGLRISPALAMVYRESLPWFTYEVPRKSGQSGRRRRSEKASFCLPGEAFWVCVPLLPPPTPRGISPKSPERPISPTGDPGTRAG